MVTNHGYNFSCIESNMFLKISEEHEKCDLVEHVSSLISHKHLTGNSESSHGRLGQSLMFLLPCESSLMPNSTCIYFSGEDAEEEESEENPIAVEFQEDQEAFYLKDPKKALQWFFDREGVSNLTQLHSWKIQKLTLLLCLDGSFNKATLGHPKEPEVSFVECCKWDG